jgi:hypothetical protein
MVFNFEEFSLLRSGVVEFFEIGERGELKELNHFPN